MNYIKRHSYGLEIDNEVLSNTLIKYLNGLCLTDGSTLFGREDFGRHILKCSLPPIYVNDDILLIYTSSLRKYETVLINVFNIDSMRVLSHGIEILFIDMSKIQLNTTKNKFNKQLIKASNLVKYIKKRKCLQRRVIDRFYI